MPLVRRKGVMFCWIFSFREKPDVKQEEYSRVIDISWREATLHLAKCVDYYFVEYAELANGTSPAAALDGDNATAGAEPVQFQKIGVQLTRKNVTELREFVEQSIDPDQQQRWTKYAAQIRSVQYNTTYVIRVCHIYFYK